MSGSRWLVWTRSGMGDAVTLPTGKAAGLHPPCENDFWLEIACLGEFLNYIFVRKTLKYSSELVT